MNCVEIEEKIGYTFSDKALLMRAFTLSSYANAYKKESNERLEFLGDAVLEMIVSEKLYGETDGTEGEMTEKRKRFVSDENLFQVVETLGLKKYLLYVGKEQDNLGKKAVPSLFEALTAAIYLDGGYEKAKEFVGRFLWKNAEKEDYISALKMYLEKRGKGLRKTDWTETKTGKDNAPQFTESIVIDGRTFTGKGGDTKTAKQSAAKSALDALKQE